MVRIVVAVKHVPAEGKVHVSKRTGKPVFDLEKGVMNPLGKRALEVGLRLKSQAPGSELIAVSIGPSEAAPTLREALAMGADRAILVDDPLVIESDGLGIARALTAVVRKLGDVDLLLTGARTTDRHAGTVGPAAAALLGWQVATHGRHADLQGDRITFEKVLMDGDVAELDLGLPCMLSIGEAAPPARHATSWGVHAAHTSSDYATWSLDDLDLARDQVGPSAAVTTIEKVEKVPDRERDTEVFDGEPEDVAQSLVRRLASRGLLP